ncbi:MAG: hypothetical protein MHM6MM_002455 [Cercozoa sp. M6MM]
MNASDASLLAQVPAWVLVIFVITAVSAVNRLRSSQQSRQQQRQEEEVNRSRHRIERLERALCDSQQAQNDAQQRTTQAVSLLRAYAANERISLRQVAREFRALVSAKVDVSGQPLKEERQQKLNAEIDELCRRISETGSDESPLECDHKLRHFALRLVLLLREQIAVGDASHTERLKTQLQQAKSHAASLDEAVAFTQSELRAARTSASQLLAKHAKVEAALASAETRIRDLSETEAQAKELENTVAELKQVRDTLRTQLQSAEAKAQSLNQELLQLRKERDEFEKQRTETQQQLQLKQEAHSSALENLNKQLSDVTQKLESAIAERDEALQRIEAAEREKENDINDLQAKLNTAQSEESKLHQQREALSTKLEVADAEVRRLLSVESENESLAKLLDEAKADRDETQAKLQSLESDLQERSAAARDLHEQLLAATSANKEVTAQLAEAKARVTQLETFEREGKQLLEEAVKLREQLDSLRAAHVTAMAANVTDLAQLRSTVRLAFKSLAVARSDRIELESVRESLTTDLETERVLSSSLRQKLNAANRQLSESQDEQTQLQALLQLATKEKHDAVEREQQAEKRLRRRRDSLRHSQLKDAAAVSVDADSRTPTDSSVSVESEELRVLREEVARLQEDQRLADEERESLLLQSKLSNEECAKLREQAARQESQVQRLRRAYAAKEAQNEKLTAKFQKHGEMLSLMRSKIEQTEDENYDLAEQCDRLQRDFDDALSEADQWQAEALARRHADYDTADRIAARVHTFNQSLEQKFAELQQLTEAKAHVIDLKCRSLQIRRQVSIKRFNSMQERLESERRRAEQAELKLELQSEQSERLRQVLLESSRNTTGRHETAERQLTRVVNETERLQRRVRALGAQAHRAHAVTVSLADDKRMLLQAVAAPSSPAVETEQAPTATASSGHFEQLQKLRRDSQRLSADKERLQGKLQEVTAQLELQKRRNEDLVQQLSATSPPRPIRRRMSAMTPPASTGHRSTRGRRPSDAITPARAPSFSSSSANATSSASGGRKHRLFKHHKALFDAVKKYAAEVLLEIECPLKLLYNTDDNKVNKNDNEAVFRFGERKCTIKWHGSENFTVVGQGHQLAQWLKRHGPKELRMHVARLARQSGETPTAIKERLIADLRRRSERLQQQQQQQSLSTPARRARRDSVSSDISDVSVLSLVSHASHPSLPARAPSTPTPARPGTASGNTS